MEITGLEELIKDINDMEIGDTKLKKGLKAGCEVFQRSMIENIAKRTGMSQKSIKTSITRLDGDLVGKVTVRRWTYGFNEWGTSKNKKNIGRIAKAIDGVTERAIILAKNEVLK